MIFFVLTNEKRPPVHPGGLAFVGIKSLSNVSINSNPGFLSEPVIDNNDKTRTVKPFLYFIGSLIKFLGKVLHMDFKTPFVLLIN